MTEKQIWQKRTSDKRAILAPEDAIVAHVTMTSRRWPLSSPGLGWSVFSRSWEGPHAAYLKEWTLLRLFDSLLEFQYPRVGNVSCSSCTLDMAGKPSDKLLQGWTIADSSSFCPCHLNRLSIYRTILLCLNHISWKNEAQEKRYWTLYGYRESTYQFISLVWYACSMCIHVCV